tara:strand:+ start:72 stop:278 length:207 start_codon:yes stop_codon:yes gene_type:complete
MNDNGVKQNEFNEKKQLLINSLLNKKKINFEEKIIVFSILKDLEIKYNKNPNDHNLQNNITILKDILN